MKGDVVRMLNRVDHCQREMDPLASTIHACGAALMNGTNEASQIVLTSVRWSARKREWMSPLELIPGVGNQHMHSQTLSKEPKLAS